jgi:penicillin-binding protein 1A
MDSPQALGGVDQSLAWKPRNYDGEFKGPMTLRNALEVSRNIPTVRLVQDLGVKKIHDFVKRWHIKATLPQDMSISLGSFGISLAELTKAYAIFPNGGKAVHLRHIVSIKDRTGKTYKPPMADQGWPEGESENKVSPTEGAPIEATQSNPFLQNLSSEQVYDPRLAYVMSNILRGVTLYGTAASAGKLSTNIGGKTGTTNNYVDALFVGFSENVVAGSWVGFDDNRPLGYSETGGKTALPIWMDFMSHALSKYGAGDFKVPDGITHLMINKDTGRVLSPGQEGFLESFVTGFDPNTDTSKIFDQNSQDQGVQPAILDDANYWENQ